VQGKFGVRLPHGPRTPRDHRDARRCAGARTAQAYLPEDNLAYPVQIVVANGGGTGFFVRRERELFLVTARHVVFDQATGQLNAPEFTLRALSKDVKETR
jgi:hypothetical protein